jgi:hypothetical protein
MVMDVTLHGSIAAAVAVLMTRIVDLAGTYVLARMRALVYPVIQ